MITNRTIVKSFPKHSVVGDTGRRFEATANGRDDDVLSIKSEKPHRDMLSFKKSVGGPTPLVRSNSIPRVNYSSMSGMSGYYTQLHDRRDSLGASVRPNKSRNTTDKSKLSFAERAKAIQTKALRLHVLKRARLSDKETQKCADCLGINNSESQSNMMPTKDKKLPFDKKQSKQVVGGLDCEESLKASLLQKDRNIVMLKKMAVMAELMYEHKGEEKALANLKRRVYKRIEMITIAAVMVFVFFWLFRNEDHVKMMLQDVKEFLLDKW